MADVNWVSAVLGAVVAFALLAWFYRAEIRHARPSARARPGHGQAVRLVAPGTCLWQDLQNSAELQQCGGVCDGATNGQQCVVSCPAGKALGGALEGQQQITYTCLDGAWSSLTEAPQCVDPAAMCPALYPSDAVGFQAGSVCIGATEGDICKLACGEGLFPNGPSFATCHNGQWSNPLCCSCGSMVDEIACSLGCASSSKFCVRPDGSFAQQ
jgi:hypothetical protein